MTTSLDTMVTTQGVPLRQALAAVFEKYKNLDGRSHDIVVYPKDFEGRPGVIGGVQIQHYACCPGRIDALVYAEPIQIGMVRK